MTALMQHSQEQRFATRNEDGTLAVADEVACYQLSLVNVVFLGPPGAGDREWLLVDGGLAWSGPFIRQAARRRFGRNSRPAAILLTHGHFDHVGAVRELADEWDVPIFAHRLEFPYLTGQSPYPPADPTVGGGAMAFLAKLYPRGPYDFRARLQALPEDGSVPFAPDWRWHWTPGHAPGHVSYFRDSDRTLVAGDAFVTLRQESALEVLTQPTHVRRPPAYFTPDWQAAQCSVEDLAHLHPEAVVTGHGLPMFGETLRNQLEDLARHFDEDAIPAHGRYAELPAIMDKDGIRYVPPAVPDHQLRMALALGIGGAALWYMLRRAKRA